MPQDDTPDYVIHRSYDDFDQMCEEVRQWDLDFRQLDRGRFSAEVLQFGVGSIHITEATFGRCLLQAGAPPEGLRTIAIPANPHVRIKWRGCEVEGTDLMIFPKGAELDSVSDEHFKVYTCSFPEDLLISLSEKLGIADLDDLQNGREIVPCSGQTVSRIQSLLKRISRLAISKPGALQNQFSQRAILSELPQLVLLGVEESSGTTTPTLTNKRAVALQKAIHFLEKFARQPITINDLVNELDVSKRTLEYAFREGMGVTPKFYLMSYRMNRIRRQLCHSKTNQAKISDIANHWGIWHMGQFARDYEKFFGELPSQTMQGSLPSSDLSLS